MISIIRCFSIWVQRKNGQLWKSVKKIIVNVFESFLDIRVQRLDISRKSSPNEVIYFNQARGTIRVVELN